MLNSNENRMGVDFVPDLESQQCCSTRWGFQIDGQTDDQTEDQKRCQSSPTVYLSG
jgi:hypothetical protein